MRLLRLTVICGIALHVATGAGFALSPNEVLVAYNSRELPDPLSNEYAIASQVIPASEGVARYYAGVRGIPSGNLLGLSQSPFTEYASENQYEAAIATPISTYLSTHPNIKCIVLCYGVPCRISVPDPSNWNSVDAALMLLGNSGTPTAKHWGLGVTNPYYGKDTDFETFRDSPDNHLPGPGGSTWKINYLVCRLDGYASPTTTVTVDEVSYDIPTDVKALIDRAYTANNNGMSGLTDAIAVLDDGRPNSQWTFSSAFASSLNDLLAPITGESEGNVDHETDPDTYCVDKSNVIAYSSGGSYDTSAGDFTTWWRPLNHWLPGGNMFHSSFAHAVTLYRPSMIY